MTPTIHILLPVHNRCDITRRFIAALRIQSYQNYRLVLIDDGSTDGTEKMVRSIIPSAIVVKGTGEWWWAGSLQAAYCLLRSQQIPLTDIILIINDDIRIERDFLEKALSILKHRTRTLLLTQTYDLGTRQVFDTGIHVDWRRLQFRHAETVSEVNCLSTRGLFLRWADFVKIGGFYPRLLPHYLSDYEFSIRARRKGMELITDELLRATVEVDNTGYRSFKNDKASVFFKKYFSVKSTANPFAWTVFIAMSCPWPWKFLNWFRVWRTAAGDACNSFLISFENLKKVITSK